MCVEIPVSLHSASMGSTATSRVIAHAAFFENHFEWTEVRERRLQQVEANERSKPEPVLAVKMGQREAQ
jgi:hypothetical protein